MLSFQNHLEGSRFHLEGLAIVYVSPANDHVSLTNLHDGSETIM
jgi:hypothetical protein